jgi:transposase
MEACAGAHYLARRLTSFEHLVKLISSQFGKAFVKSTKNDLVDAEVICEAASRPAMRFVTSEAELQRALSALHRVRESLVRDRTKAINQINGFLFEFEISLPIGMNVSTRLPAVLAEHALPSPASLHARAGISSISAGKSRNSRRRSGCRSPTKTSTSVC